MNKKGFTMVELLVAMAIMGLLIIMAFPTIRAIQANNQKSNFEQYGRSVISASKLYVDSYGEDMFATNQKFGSANISVLDLKKKDLVKNIGISGTDCSSSKVLVIKNEDDYTYCLHLVCMSGTTKVYDVDDQDVKKQCANLDIVNIEYEKGSITKSEDILKGTTNYIVKNPAQLGFENPSSIKGWKDASAGKTYAFGDKIAGPIDDDITLTADDSGDEDESIDIPIDQNKNYVKIRINVNDAILAPTHGNYTIDGNGFVHNGEGSIYIHNIPYGGKLSDSGLINYNNSKHLKIINDYMHIEEGLEWNLLSSGSGKSFDQKTAYKASDFCDASKNDCVVTLYANWKKNTCTVTYNAGKNKETTASNYKDDEGKAPWFTKNNGVEVSKYKKDTTVYAYDKNKSNNSIGGSAGMRDCQGGYYTAKWDGHVIDRPSSSEGAQWRLKRDGDWVNLDEKKSYSISTLCPNIKTEANTNVNLYVKWKTKSPQLIIHYWDYVSKDCEGYKSRSGDSRIDNHPYRKYVYFPFRCYCNYKAADSTLDTAKAYLKKHSMTTRTVKEGNTTYTTNCKNSPFLYHEANKTQQKVCFPEHAYIYYRATNDGIKACNNDGHKINQYVYQVCTQGDVYNNHGSNKKGYIYFHGAHWYWGEKATELDYTGQKNYYTPHTATYYLHDKKRLNEDTGTNTMIDKDELTKKTAEGASKLAYNNNQNSKIQKACRQYCSKIYGNPRHNYRDDDEDLKEEND